MRRVVVIPMVIAMALILAACADDSASETGIGDVVPDGSTTSSGSTVAPATAASSSTTTEAPGSPAYPDDERPPASCDGAVVRGHVGGDDDLDWVRAEPIPNGNDETRYTVCDSQRDSPYGFDGPAATELRLVDHDRDGIDELFFLGRDDGGWDVWRRPRFQDRVERLRIDGEPLTLVAGEWVDGTSTNEPWFGCTDVDGDGTMGLALGSYVVDADTVRWEGVEYSFDWSGAPIAVRGSASSTLPAACAGAETWRIGDPGPCATAPSGGRDLEFADVENVVMVQPGDVLITLDRVVEVWRDAALVGHADASAEFGFRGAFHDGAGGVVADTADGDIVHFPFGAEPQTLYTSDRDAGVGYSLYRVTRIDGVPTVLVVHRQGREENVRGEFVFHPLDGSAVRTLPSHDYYEGGTFWIDWDGERFVILEGGEGYLAVRGMTLGGEDVDVGWNIYPDEMEDLYGLTFAVDDRGTVWTARGTGTGSLVQQRDRDDGRVEREVWLPAETEWGRTIEILGDTLLVSGASGDACTQIYDPTDETLTPLREGGRGSVAI